MRRWTSWPCGWHPWQGRTRPQSGEGLDADPAGFALTRARPPWRGQACQQGIRMGRRRSSPQRLLMMVDQFEQLFTQCPDEEQRQAFITALHAAAAGNNLGRAPAALVVLAVRADFEAAAADYPQLATAVQDRYLVTSMTGRQLRMAITEPAKKAGARVDDDLVEVLLQEVSTRQPAPASRCLPSWRGFPVQGCCRSLSHALDQAWRSRIGDVLTLADYERAGGIERAIADSAQTRLRRLTRAQQGVARQIFTRLTATSSDGVDTADRAAPCRTDRRQERSRGTGRGGSPRGLRR